HSTRQPGKSGSSVRTRTSSGSPSSALVSGTKPKSYGKTMPSGRIFDKLYIFFAGSYLILLRLPRGVSIVMLTVCGLEAAALLGASTVLRFMTFSSCEPGHRLPHRRARDACEGGAVPFRAGRLEIGLSQFERKIEGVAVRASRHPPR